MSKLLSATLPSLGLVCLLQIAVSLGERFPECYSKGVGSAASSTLSLSSITNSIFNREVEGTLGKQGQLSPPSLRDLCLHVIGVHFGTTWSWKGAGDASGWLAQASRLLDSFTARRSKGGMSCSAASTSWHPGLAYLMFFSSFFPPLGGCHDLFFSLHPSFVLSFPFLLPKEMC